MSVINCLMATNILCERVFEGCTLRVKCGDIRRENVDAIVNAANNTLSHGDGIAAAINHENKLFEEDSAVWMLLASSSHITELAEGRRVAVTDAGKLPAKRVFNVVGPQLSKGAKPTAPQREQLRNCVASVLNEAHVLEYSSISMPGISSGLYHFPREECAKIMIEAAMDWLSAIGKTPVKEINFINVDMRGGARDGTAQVFKSAMEKFVVGGMVASPPTEADNVATLMQSIEREIHRVDKIHRRERDIIMRVVMRQMLVWEKSWRIARTVSRQELEDFLDPAKPSDAARNKKIYDAMESVMKNTHNEAVQAVDRNPWLDV